MLTPHANQPAWTSYQQLICDELIYWLASLTQLAKTLDFAVGAVVNVFLYKSNITVH